MSILSMACVHAHAKPAAQDDLSTLYVSAESPVRSKSERIVGEGPYSYRFVVRSPQRIDRPHRQAGYKILLRNGSVFNDDSDVYRGTTDALGRTATFRTRKPVALADWDVRPEEGQGDFNESFVLKAEDNEGLVNFAYMVDIADGPLYCGHSLPGGHTAHYRTPHASTATLHYDISSSECHQIRRQVNAVMLRPASQARASGLRQLLRDPGLTQIRPMLQEKLDALILREGSLEEVKRLVASRLAAQPDASPAERSSTLNDFGYDLAKQNPPRHLHYAHELVDQSLALDTTLYNLDTKGWILYQMGRHEEALGWLDRALALFKMQCTESEKAAYAENLGHRGLALWTLKRPGDALVDWARADRMTDDGTWTNGLPDWARIGPLIKSTRARLDTLDNEPSTCRETVAPAETEAGKADTP